MVYSVLIKMYSIRHECARDNE